MTPFFLVPIFPFSIFNPPSVKPAVVWAGFRSIPRNVVLDSLRVKRFRFLKGHPRVKIHRYFFLPVL